MIEKTLSRRDFLKIFVTEAAAVALQACSRTPKPPTVTPEPSPAPTKTEVSRFPTATITLSLPTRAVVQTETIGPKELQREDLFPADFQRENIMALFYGSSSSPHIYIPEHFPTDTNNVVKAFRQVSETYSNKILPSYVNGDWGNYMKLFGYCWDKVSLYFSYGRPDISTPLEKLPASFREENYTQEMVTYLGILRQLQDPLVSKEAVTFLADFVNFQKLMIDPSTNKDYFFKKDDYANILKEMGDLKGPIYSAASPSTLKLLNLQLTIQYLYGLNETITAQQYAYFRRDKSPVALGGMPEGIYLGKYLADFARTITI